MGLDYEIIEKYLNGELSPEELAAFNLQLETDKDFKQEVELYLEINKSLENKYKNLEKEKQLKETLLNTSANYFNTENKEEKSIPIKSYFIKIASIAAILILGFFLLKPQTSLYNQFADHAALEVQVKGDNDETLLKAAQFFNDKEYEQSIPLLEEYLRSNPEDTEIQMSLGIALLETEEEDLEKAALIFEHIYEEDNIFKAKATWYLALVNVKNNRNEEAKVYLEEINQNSFYYSQAQKLLKKL